MPNELSLNEELIKKVENLIETNLENEQFGVNELAEELGASRSHLHRKLNALTGKSTSQFIREYRLQKAMVMLQDNVATASEIAYRVGFSSPTYFNTRFSEYFGYPPGEVKYRSSKTEDADSNIPIRVTSKRTRKKVKRKKLSSQLGILVAVFGGIALLVFLFITFNNPTVQETELVNNKESNVGEKSIAVLPFKNLSNDESNQYFADGMRDDIINHLSKIESVLVKSRQSSDRYGSTDLSGLEIGEALGVNYIIDGSVQKYDDRIKIIVHLINAKNDTHLWSKDFDREFEDIFYLESEISRSIAKELNLVLSPSEIQEIEKIPTVNLEAYNLYKKGDYFLYQFSDEGFMLAEKYFNESIELDPKFALPYSGLSILSLYRGWPSPSEEDYLTAKGYALKAIELDDDLAETHRALGLIFME
ncbi:helix-turn-helix domain-containing protein [Flavisericum labens]|uniref:helix-turn-helix domain-containing protein n=1 Tax=Flavisericum labens TaxID=3377112 RepID=UPI00387AD210